MKKQKVYRLKTNLKKGAEVSAIALVEEPAHESTWLAFGKDYQEFQSDNTKKELLGAALIPQKLIYRKDKKTGEEYHVYFEAEDIREIAQQYMKAGYQTQMNLGHTSIPAKSFVFQSFIVDDEMEVKSPKNLNLPNGSWVIGVKVEDEMVWNDIQEKKVSGFSVEGLFDFIEMEFEKEEDDEAELEMLLNRLNNIINKNIKNVN
jgi:hypothetical protein